MQLEGEFQRPVVRKSHIIWERNENKTNISQSWTRGMHYNWHRTCWLMWFNVSWSVVHWEAYLTGCCSAENPLFLSLLCISLSVFSVYCYRYYYVRQGGYVIFVVCLSDCLLATLRKDFSLLTHSKRIWMKFSGNVANRPMNKWLNFGGDPYHDTVKTCLGGGMHCPSASSSVRFRITSSTKTTAITLHTYLPPF